MAKNSGNTAKPVVVIGDGWSALGAVGFLAQTGAKVHWLAGTGTRMFAPLPTLESGPGVEFWKELAAFLQIDCGEVQTGSYLREFRNKSFRVPAWNKAPTPEMRREVLKESLWTAECSLVNAFEARFTMPLGELEEEIRKRLLNEELFPNVRRIEGVPLAGFRFEEGAVRAVILGSGEEIVCERVIYCDRWNFLPGLPGIPKNLPFIRKREPMGIVQATFVHGTPMGAGLMEGFFATLHKEIGEEDDRHLLGYFSQDGTRSFWSLAISADDAEDNHAIAKKLRRLKSALDKIFVGTDWLPAGKADFMSNVIGEQVRFEENVIFSEGTPPAEPIIFPELGGLAFVTDGYGPSSALAQVGRVLGKEPRPNTQAEDLNSAESVSL